VQLINEIKTRTTAGCEVPFLAAVFRPSATGAMAGTETGGNTSDSMIGTAGGASKTDGAAIADAALITARPRQEPEFRANAICPASAADVTRFVVEARFAARMSAAIVHNRQDAHAALAQVARHSEVKAGRGARGRDAV
jgi:hypothetical protein